MRSHCTVCFCFEGFCCCLGVGWMRRAEDGQMPRTKQPTDKYRQADKSLANESDCCTDIANLFVRSDSEFGQVCGCLCK